MEDVVVEVEYCNKCGYLLKFEELKKHVADHHSIVTVVGREGRRGGLINQCSFEVKINESLVHSKLQTLAYPDYNDLGNLIEDAKNGKSVNRQCKQQPITSCAIS